VIWIALNPLDQSNLSHSSSNETLIKSLRWDMNLCV
jgi:hypothetical protein